MKTPLRRGRHAAHALLLLGFSLSPATFAAIGGTVFHDYNANGIRDAGGAAAAADRGIGGVAVRAYGLLGPCGTATTTNAGSGTYTLDVTGCAPGVLRVEFTGYPAGMEPSFHARASSGATVATQAGTTVQFAADGTVNLDVALNVPAQYCQNDPPLAVPEQAFGDPQAPANASLDAIVRFPYSVAGSVATPQPTGPVGVAGVPEIGTVYGLAYDRSRDRLFVGAYHKRHAGFGPGGTGAIYRVDAAASGAPATPATFVDLNAVFGPGTAGTDTVRGNYLGTMPGGDQTWDEVGKSSLGDIELDDAGTRLYVVNLADRRLYAMPSTGTPTVATIVRSQIPHPCATSIDARPFGLAYRNGTLYVTGVCSGQSTQQASDLRAWIYAYDTATGMFNATPVMSFALNYPRAAGNDDAINDPTGDDVWRPWSPAQGTPAANGGMVYPEPMFSDLVFDGDDIVLGLRDRHGDQTGTGLVGTIQGITGGEILRACSNGAGGWDLEANGSCGGVAGVAGTTTNQARGPAAGGNTRGGEFYPLEHYSNETPPFFINDTPPDYNGRHDETAQGALTQIPGYPQVATTAMDPFRYGTGGIRWYTNAAPASVADTRGYEIYLTGSAGFAKANGLGDMNALCRVAPVEVGNYVWIDIDHDGVMDPGEPPVANVLLTLYDAAGVAIGRATTDANGEYYFTFTRGAADSDATDNAVINPTADTQTYTIGIMPANFAAGGALEGLIATTPDNGGATNGDLRDSDGVAVTIAGSPATLGATFTLTGPGINDHTIDFGFVGNFDLALTKRLAAGQTGPFIAGQDVTFDIVVINQGGIAAVNIVVNDDIPAGFALSPVETNWTSVSPTLATRTIAGPLAAGASTTVSITLRVQSGAPSPLVNRAEIGSADDDGDNGTPPPRDIDSTPDSDPANDAGGSPGTPSDDATGGDGSGTPGDGDPAGDEDDADPASITVGSPAAVLGVAKAAQILSVTGGDVYGGGGTPPTAQLAYVLVVRNYATQDITNLQVVENLATAFGAGNHWSVVSVTAPTLAVNPAFDGRGTTNLLLGTDTLAAGASTTIRIVVTVQFVPGQRYANQVVGSGFVGTAPVSDTSNDGDDPAPSGDPGGNSGPTVVTLGTQSVPTLSGIALALMFGGLVLLALRLRRHAA